MPRTVLLEHRVPDGESHFDWLLAPDVGPYEPDDRVLIAFRVTRRVDSVDLETPFEAERIPDHRFLYLDYQGELSRGRGDVERLAEGMWKPSRADPETIEGTIAWMNGCNARIKGRLIEGDRWVFQSTTALGR